MASIRVKAPKVPRVKGIRLSKAPKAPRVKRSSARYPTTATRGMRTPKRRVK